MIWRESVFLARKLWFWRKSAFCGFGGKILWFWWENMFLWFCHFLWMKKIDIRFKFVIFELYKDIIDITSFWENHLHPDDPIWTRQLISKLNLNFKTHSDEPSRWLVLLLVVFLEKRNSVQKDGWVIEDYILSFTVINY